MTLAIALRLGRISNIPTIWTNVLVGIVLSGGVASDPRIWPLLAALSVFYIGGMFLNDAFDAAIDAVERPERPIPSGLVGRTTVFVYGFGLLAAGEALLIWTGIAFGGGVLNWLAFSGLLLGIVIVYYNAYHKNNPASPFFMGLCRVLVYVTAGLAITVPPEPVLLIGAGLLLSHLIGLTYLAKQENLGSVKNVWPLIFLAAPLVYGVTMFASAPHIIIFWVLLAGCDAVGIYFIRRCAPGDIPRAVIMLIAGICLLDAMLIAGAGEVVLASVAIVGFFATLALQKLVSGT